MENTLRYQAARIVAPLIENHFSRHLLAAQKRGETDLAVLPPSSLIEAIIDTAFWASLRREEGNSPKISIAFLPPKDTPHILLFEHTIPLTPAALSKLSPGVERPGIHIGVWFDEDHLYIWGTTLKIPNLCFVLDVSEPGLLVVKHRRMHGFGKFTNVAVLTGDQVKVVDEQHALAADSPELLKFLLGVKTDHQDNAVNLLIQLAVSMRAHQHGGILLVVPEQTDAWRSSIIHPIKYTLLPSYAGITNMIAQGHSLDQSLWQASLRQVLDSIAGLTAVDGATVINQRFELLAFGAKISRAEGKPRIEKVLAYEPIAGSSSAIINPTQHGGTRHLAAAQFVYDQHDSIALVASQDGLFTMFSWSPLHHMVQSHRMDALLL